MSDVLQPERWQRLRPLLDQALDLDVEGRAALLAQVAAESAELHADLQRLLVHRLETQALDAPAAELVGDQLQADTPALSHYVGKRVGAFELRRVIGSGGMGVVYEAERVDGGFRQRVAIKLIAGMHPALTDRFARERQILADLRHPAIPPLLDGGRTDDGMPYFALEYVEGRNLLEQARALQAELDTRLGWLLTVAGALASAHRQRVLHRDIKPSNILVTADGEVKLLDFGIAKLLDHDGPALTRQVLGPMTPEYAAPEQFRGEAVTVATDIYQFGVLMFELLADRSPYRCSSLNALEFARAVCEVPPLSLDAALREPCAKPVQGWRDARQRRDATRVIDRCLAKVPSDRYPDMDRLIADLEALRAGRGLSSAARPRWRPQRLRTTAVLILAAALCLTVLGWGLAQIESDPWTQSPALHALGLDRSHLYTSRPDTEALLQRALMLEARGELASATTLLSTLHAADTRTPIPALLLGYWSIVHEGREAAEHWQAEAAQRLAPLKDPLLDLLLKFIQVDVAGDYDAVLSHSAALLDAAPQAWFIRLARSHILNASGFREAALTELQQIDAERLDHRKLIDAIADRASFGDLIGARQLAQRYANAGTDAEHALLQARLAYSAGDLSAARDQFAAAVEHAKRSAYLHIESRGLLYLGIVEGSLGRYESAAIAVTQARQRFETRHQYGYAADCALVLAQLEAFAGHQDAVRAALDSARALHARAGGTEPLPMIELFAARLLGERPQRPSKPDPALNALIDARLAAQDGNPAQAQQALARAEREGAASSYWSDEYALMRRELGLSAPDLPSLDPPFQPYARFASRWVLGTPILNAPLHVGTGGE